jgi:DNA anti-recombination protein RmuC
MTTEKKSLKRLDLIRLIGEVITAVDVLRSHFDREDTNRKRLDNIRDGLDTYQRKLVRSVIKENTAEFEELTASLEEVNENLRLTIEDVNKTAATLEALVKLVGIVQKIAELIP